MPIEYWIWSVLYNENGKADAIDTDIVLRELYISREVRLMGSRVHLVNFRVS